MFKGTITFEATEQTEDEVVEKILFDMNEEIRREGVSITIQEIEDTGD